MTLETVQPATATQTATTIELKSDRVTVTFNPATGMISRITSGGTEAVSYTHLDVYKRQV